MSMIRPTPVKWLITGSEADNSGLYVERMLQRDGSHLFAVRTSFGHVMNHSGEFEHEPQPSSRDDAFMARCRFKSLSAAIKTAMDTGHA